ncbi:uncharacterized protein LOC128206618 isoform X2 [Mya arenaria]|uniref:uncharacterized protein LOC128206618 isoform X2 n=1 Tax=Mya arenaria TaxID=6604 RepID=UPI0022DF6A2B|nr:uncharacterized protein LOC128206618 isoform X2 [Mya arenaria]
MASKQVQCDMCSNEKAIRFCNTCGNIGYTCFRIHKTGRKFQTHIVKMFRKDGHNSKCIMYDITDKICKHHPTERALLFCRTHDSMICGRCLHADHLSCGNEVVDLCLETRSIDFDQVNAMSAALNEIKGDTKRIMEEFDTKIETNNSHVVNCNKEFDDWENKLKQKVEDSISVFRQEVCKINDENIYAFSCIYSVCENISFWVDKKEGQIDDYVNNSLTGYLYLMNRNFDKKISEVKRQMKEAKHKHIFKQFCLKENKVALKCLMDDLMDVCELQEEVDGSDEGNAISIGIANQEPQMTRKKLEKELEMARDRFANDSLESEERLEQSEETRKKLDIELFQAKLVVEKSEKIRQELSDELENVKQDLNNLEKARDRFENDSLGFEERLEDSEEARKELNDVLTQVKQKLDKSEKTRKMLEKEFIQAKQILGKSEKTRRELSDEIKQVKQDLDN